MSESTERNGDSIVRTALATALLGLSVAASALGAQPALAAGLEPQSAPVRMDGPTGPWPPTGQAPPTAPSALLGDDGRFGVQLLDAPVSEAADPRAHEYIIDNLQPGETISRRIEIFDVGAGPLQASVYPDAATIADGSFTGGPGQTVSELTSWTSLAQGAVAVPADGSVIDTVTVTVPRDAAPGERYGVIWASVTRPGNRSGALTTINRVGIRMYLNVGGDNPPASALTVNSLTALRDAHGRPILRALVHNTGGRALDLSGTVKLAAVSGPIAAGPYPIELGTTLAPGQTEPVEAVITGQPADGPWNATVELRSGLLDETFTGRITFPADPGSSAPVAAHLLGSGRTTTMITAGALGLAALGGAAVPLVRRRRR